jgi:2-(1,2-epoxy-1,2-dihydrophenyl)acetyl-CoA isomerase
MDSLHKRYNPIVAAMRSLPKPIVCRLNGVAAGAGCSLALACDIIVASEEATLIEVFVNIGLSGFWVSLFSSASGGDGESVRVV